MTPAQTRTTGYVAFVAFLLCIPLANWMIGNVGTVCVPDGPCLVPVAPGIMAPTGVLGAGVSLVLRDVVQRCLGIIPSFVAIVLGAALSALIAPPALVIASTIAFTLSELADLAVYTPLQRRGLLLAVIASALLGLLVDSIVFLQLAFHSLDFLAGQVVGKLWAVLFSLPLIRLMRRAAPTAAVLAPT